MALADLVSDFAQLKILGACRTPFTVKGGGHATNPGFSSTSGVEVALTRFNSTKSMLMMGRSRSGLASIGTKYMRLGVNLVGGRVPGVGVAGLTIGGGRRLPRLDGS